MHFLRSVRLWFSLAIAVISAALADLFLETTSNAGLFGHATYTDHSNLDVLPALGVGLAALAVHVALRIRSGLRGDCDEVKERLRRWDVALRSRAPMLLPLTVAAQLLALYSMETLEQTLVAGHPLGGLIWLGAPAVIALAVHALTCVVVFFFATSVMHQLAWATLRAVTILRAILTRDDITGLLIPRLRVIPRKRLAPKLCTAGGRAPPPYAR